MNTLLFATFLYLIAQHFISAQTVIPVKDPNNIVVTFGSCNKYFGEDEHHIFYRIADLKPDVWIWLGDVAYVDHRVMPGFFIYAGETKIRKKFTEVKNSVGYRHLKNKTNIIGVWDDHDYGLNNGGKYFKHKTLTQQIWLDFIDEPLDSPRRKRHGIYESYYLGDTSKVKVILLDVRYNKDERSVLGGGDMLGEHQWEWLEEELKNNPATFTLIGSGTQVLPDDRIFPEHWYSESRDRLINLLKKYKTHGVLLISGDVHYAEIMKHPCRERVGFDLYEFTSSGMTHVAGQHIPHADNIINSVFPDTFNTDEDRYFERNFGVVKFSFEEERPHVKLEARNHYGVKVLEEDIDYLKLKFDEEILDDETVCMLDENPYGRFYEKVVESIIDGNFYPILMIWLLSCIVIGAIWIGGLFTRLIRFIIGYFWKSDKKAKKDAKKTD